MKIADHSSTKFPDDEVFEKLAHWIIADRPMLVTGYFGKGNDVGIAKTAVAAGATVNQRVRVALQLAGVDGPVHGPGGFLFFAPCEEPTLAMSFIPQVKMGQKFGIDFVEYFDDENPTWHTANAPDRGHMQYIGRVVQKPIAWEKRSRHVEYQTFHRRQIAR